jgi:O-antigen/teichoic acid export membrane protein
VADDPALRPRAFRMNATVRTDAVSRPAFLLVAGRTLGFVVTSAIPIVLARLFGRAEFGTYKQLFLIYATLYGLAQAGMAESLYYFIPRQPAEAGRRVTNAVATLALVAAGCVVILFAERTRIAAWMTNPDLARYLPTLAVFLAFTLVSAGFEIVLVSRKAHAGAAAVYACSDLARSVCLVVPALALWGLRGVIVGAATFAALRLAAMAVCFRREFGRGLAIDPVLWRGQLAYALPFGLAVGVEVVQANLHQYVVASRFDVETFAIYAVGCLQIPLVDLICTSTANVMMVKMAEDAGKDHDRAALALWHATTCRLATVVFPLAVLLLLTGRGIIVTLFTARYVASVPIFMIWCLTIIPSAFSVDAVLRVYARTRFLLVMNVVRLVLIAASIGWFLTTFGLAGAVLVTLLSTSVVKALGVLRIARLLGVGLGDVLPWRRLTHAAVQAGIAAVPAFWVNRAVASPAPAAVIVTGTVYAVTFAAIWWLWSWWDSGGVVTAFPPLPASPRLDASD